jgi:hypothetical protein
MHLTLNKEATRPAGANILQQQGKFDAFIEEFNRERPHEALAMKCPAEVYSPSCRPYEGTSNPTTHSTTGRFWSPVVAGSACTARRSI